jgi:hypothetical protein
MLWKQRLNLHYRCRRILPTTESDIQICSTIFTCLIEKNENKEIIINYGFIPYLLRLLTFLLYLILIFFFFWYLFILFFFFFHSIPIPSCILSLLLVLFPLLTDLNPTQHKKIVEEERCEDIIKAVAEKCVMPSLLEKINDLLKLINK